MMKNLYRVLSITYVMVVLLCFSQYSNAQTSTNQWSKSKIEKYFADRAKSLGVEQSSLKGAGGKINSFAAQYCSDFGVIDITPDTWDPSTTSIEWTVQTFVGSEESHPDWVDVVGTGSSTVLKFYTDRVNSAYHGAPIYFEYKQKNNLGFILDAKFDYTIVYLRPTAFNVSGAPKVCIGNSASVSLSGSEVGIDYTLKRVSDDTQIGFTITGAAGGGVINFPLTPTAVGDTEYYVDAVNPDSPSCATTMNGTATVTVHDNPVITSISPAAAICLGQSTTLIATTDMDPDVDYLWDDGAGNTKNTASWDVSPTSTTTYNLTVTNRITTCSRTASVTITVNSNPTITTGSNSPVCEGSTLSLTSTPAGGSGSYTSYSWTGPNGFSAGTQNASVASTTLAASGDYTVTVTDNLGCSNTATATETVIVTERPTISVNYNAPVCQGTGLSLTATAVGGSGSYVNYVWTKGGVVIGGENASTLSIASTTLADAGTYGVTVQDNSSCVSDEATVVVTILALPVPTAGNDGPVCEGGTVNLAGGPAGLSYAWTGPNSFASTLQNPVLSNVTMAAAGSYTLTVTDGNTCEQSINTTVVINANPTITTDSNSPVCQGSDIALESSPVGGSGVYSSFSWTGPNGFTSTAQNPFVLGATLTASGDYTVTVTDNLGCTNTVTATETVLVTERPTVSVNYNAPVCQGTGLSLTATAAGGSGSYANYIWTKGGVVIGGENSSTLSITSTTLADAGTYGVTVQDNSGCASDEGTVVVTILALPVPTAGNDGPVCEGGTVNLNGGPAGLSYEWTGPNSFASTLQNPVLSNVTMAAAGSYTLTVTDGNTCQQSISTTVDINANPTITTDSNSPVCEGSALSLTSTPAGGSGSYTSFSWTGPNGFTVGTQNASVANTTLAASGDYTVTVTDNLGCTNTVTATETVLVTERPTVSVNYNAPVCQGTGLSLTATAAGGSGNYVNYIWSKGGVEIAGENGSTLTINNVIAADAATYGVIVQDISGCLSDEATVAVIIQALPIATASNDGPACLGEDVILAALPNGMVSYSWTGPNSFVSATQNPVLNTVALTNAGTYTLTVTDANTCQATVTTDLVVNQIAANLNITNPTPPGTNVCAGTTITFSGSAIDGSGNYNYEFFVDGISQGASSTIANKDITINNAVTVEVEVIDNVTGCKDRASIAMTAKPIPNINFIQPTNGQEFCEATPVTLRTVPAGYSNYVYYKTDGITDTQLNTLGTETFEVTNGFDPSITGVYVVATNNGCSAQAAVNIKVNPLPTAMAGMDQTVCEGNALSLDGSASDGTSGYTYDWTGPDNFVVNNTEDPNLGTAELAEDGTYTLTVTDSKSCKATSETIVTIDALPKDQAVVAENTEYCEASTGVRIYLQNSEAGVSYQLQDASNNPLGSNVLADGVTTVEWTNVAAGAYHVVAFGPTANACSIQMSTADITVNENPLPTIYNITPSNVDSGCNGGAGWPVGLDGSDNGVDYQLLRNGNPYGAKVSGDGNAITLNNNVTAFGVYTIRAVNQATLCSVLMNGDYEIKSDVVVTTYSMNSSPVSGDFCISDTNSGVVIGMSGSDATVEYQLILNGNSLAPEQTKIGDGNPITFDTKVTIDGVYTVQVETPGGCSFPMDGAITITAYDDPTTFDLMAENDGFYCPDLAGLPKGVNMWLVGQQAGIEYTLYRDNSASPLVVETVTGTVNNPLALLNFTAGPFVTEDAYYVEAKIPGVGCATTMNNMVTVTENTLLKGYNVSKADDFCAGSSVSIFIDGSESDAEYRWVVSNGAGDIANSAWVAGSGAAMEFAAINIEGTYRVEVRRNQNGITCFREMLNTIEVFEKPLPLDKAWNTTGGAGCDDGVVITIENSELGVTYYLYKRGATDTQITGAEIVGDGNDIQFAPISDNAAMYNVLAELNGCTNDFDINIPVDVTGAIAKLSLIGGGSVCEGGVAGANISMVEPTVFGVKYELFLVGTPDLKKAEILGDGTVRNFGTQADLGEYYVIGSNTDGSCPTEMANRVSIAYFTNPVANIVVAPNDTICAGTEVTFTASGGSNYQFYLNDNPQGAMSPVNTYTTSALSNGNRLSVMVESPEGCASRSDEIVMTVNPMPKARTVETTGTFCHGTASNVSVSVINPEAGFTYTLIDESNGSTVGTDGTLPIIFANISEGTYNVEASGNGCSMPMSNSVIITAEPLPTLFDMEPAVDVTSCADNTIKLLNSQLGVSYTLLRGVNVVGGPTDGSHDGVEIIFGDYNVSGTYRVIAQNITTGCMADMNGTFTIAAGSGNPYDVEPANGSYCEGSSRANIRLLDSDAGVSYMLYLNGVASGTELTSAADDEILDFGTPSQDGTYAIIAEDAGGCLFSMKNDVVIAKATLPTEFSLETGKGLSKEDYCPGDAGIAAIHVKGQQAGVSYILYDADDNVIGTPQVGVVDNANVDIVFSGPIATGTYHVVAVNAAGCLSDMTNTVKVSESPAIRDDFELVTSGDICSGGFATLTTNGSENGVRYWLYRNGVNTGNFIDGNGGVLDPPFIVNQGGTYALQAVNASGCRTFLVDEVVISETNLPSVKEFVSDGGGDCSTGAIIKVLLADENITYQLYKRTPGGDVLVHGSAKSHAGPGTNDLSFDPIVDSDAYYTVKASNGSCEIDMSSGPADDIYVDITDAPKKYKVEPANAEICNGDLGRTFSLKDSEAGVTYSLYRKNLSGDISLLNDTLSLGGNIEFAGTHNVPGEYYVEAVKLTCSTKMLNNPVLKVNPLPTAFKMTGSGFYCDELGAEIGLESQEMNVRYTLQFQDGSHAGTALGGAFEDSISLGKFIKEGIYRVVAINTSTLCTSNMEGIVEVIKKDGPDEQFIDPSIQTTYCGGTRGVELKLTNNQFEVTYQVIDADGKIVSEVIGANTDATTPQALSFPDLIPEGTYTIWKSRGGDACMSQTNNNEEVIIQMEIEPTDHEVTVDNASVCGSTGATITLEDSETGRFYRLEADGIAESDTIESIAGEAIVWNVSQAVAGNVFYEVFAIAGTVCDKSMGIERVIYSESPNPYTVFTELDGNLGVIEYCAGEDGLKIGVELTQLNVAYMLYDTLDMSKTVDVIIGDGSDQLYTKNILSGVYRVEALLYTTGCKLMDDDTITVTEALLPDIYREVTCNEAGTDCIIGEAICIDPNEVGVQYELFKDNETTGQVIASDSPNKVCFDAIEEAGGYTVMAHGMTSNCSAFFDTTLSYSYANYGEMMAVDDIFNIRKGLLTDTINIRANDVIIYVDEANSPNAIPYPNTLDMTNTELFFVDKYEEDFLGTGTSSNLTFHLLEYATETTLEKKVLTLSNDTVGEFIIDEKYGTLIYNKTPGFFGKYKLKYVLENTDYPGRADTAVISLYVGNEEADKDNSFLIPNAFSPNGDGFNDYYVISGTEGGIKATTSNLEVFNRWGTLVYRSKGDIYGQNGNWWDGKSTEASMFSIGSDLPNGTYFYVFKVEANVNGITRTKEYNGYIELRR